MIIIVQLVQIYISLHLIFLLLLSCSAQINEQSSLQTYIIQLHPYHTSSLLFPSKRKWHLSFIHQSSLPNHRMLYSYVSAIEGFAARLSQSELDSLKKLPGVLSVRPDSKHHLHTTYSYKFLGLNPSSPGSAWARSRFGRGTIIGVLDTGVWPESPSFDDSEMLPVPKKWKGKCQQGEDFNISNCNRKLIGARFFTKGHLASTPNMPPTVKEYASARDSHGHGTHTSSTAGGVAVPTATVLGNGAGVARGLAPGAHIAVYKVCWFSGCYSSDILAAMDVAIRDGVDILSLSLGGFPIPLYDDTIAIGSYRAVEHGVTVVCSAGNNGPVPYSVANEAPWIITVGASTLDRRFPAPVRTRNNDVLYGESMYPRMKNQLTKMEQLDLVYLEGSEICLSGSLPRDLVRGKMVVCDRGANGRAEKGQVVKEAGGAAMILATTEMNGEDDSVDVHVLPATQLGFDESMRLKFYINSTARPMARIDFEGTVIEKDVRAPAVARFSSRGPSLTDPSVLKPDVIAPGVNIIAAWPQNLGPSGLPEDQRRVDFSVMSGTSMSCPHVSGIAALVRSAHPDWSPAAVKSAIMTTADATDHLRKPIMDGHEIASLFAIGSGQVNPSRAINPGLVYDISAEDYIAHLCSLGYKSSDIFIITHRNVSCSSHKRGFSTLNYPSISLRFKTRKRKVMMVRRQVTNVGDPHSIYSVQVMPPPGLKVRVRPTRLVFNQRYQRLSYTVWFNFIPSSSNYKKKRKTQQDQFHGGGGGYLTWINTEQHLTAVRSPIAVTWLK